MTGTIERTGLDNTDILQYGHCVKIADNVLLEILHKDRIFRQKYNNAKIDVFVSFRHLFKCYGITLSFYGDDCNELHYAYLH